MDYYIWILSIYCRNFLLWSLIPNSVIAYSSSYHHLYCCFTLLHTLRTESYKQWCLNIYITKTKALPGLLVIILHHQCHLRVHRKSNFVIISIIISNGQLRPTNNLLLDLRRSLLSFNEWYKYQTCICITWDSVFISWLFQSRQCHSSLFPFIKWYKYQMTDHLISLCK